jgi:hypothetical protein
VSWRTIGDGVSPFADKWRAVCGRAACPRPIEANRALDEGEPSRAFANAHRSDPARRT